MTDHERDDERDEKRCVFCGEYVTECVIYKAWPEHAPDDGIHPPPPSNG